MIKFRAVNRCRRRQLILTFQATWAVSRPACYRLTHGHPMGMPGRPAYRAACVTGTEKRRWY